MDGLVREHVDGYVEEVVYVHVHVHVHVDVHEGDRLLARYYEGTC